MVQQTMTVVRWVDERAADAYRPARVKPSKIHVSRDGVATACGARVPEGATLVAETVDWHRFTNCYNCAYRLWPTAAPAGYIRPRNGKDFPIRSECPHRPGAGWDRLFCVACTPPATPCPHDPSRHPQICGQCTPAG